MFYKILDDYIELYKLNGRSTLDNMKSHYDCEEEYWAIIEELLDRYIELQSKIDKAIEYCEYNDEGLYTFEPDYDYEENMVDNYEPSNFREELLDILKENK